MSRKIPKQRYMMSFDKTLHYNLRKFCLEHNISVSKAISIMAAKMMEKSAICSISKYAVNYLKEIEIHNLDKELRRELRRAFFFKNSNKMIVQIIAASTSKESIFKVLKIYIKLAVAHGLKYEEEKLKEMMEELKTTKSFDSIKDRACSVVALFEEQGDDYRHKWSKGRR